MIILLSADAICFAMEGIFFNNYEILIYIYILCMVYYILSLSDCHILYLDLDYLCEYTLINLLYLQNYCDLFR